MKTAVGMVSEHFTTKGQKLVVKDGSKEIARIRLYFIGNDLHEKSYALIEDLFVEEEFRGQNLGTSLIKAAIEAAQKEGCYKILATSRHSREKVHAFYEKLGFKDHGKEFRLDLES